MLYLENWVVVPFVYLSTWEIQSEDKILKKTHKDIYLSKKHKEITIFSSINNLLSIQVAILHSIDRAAGKPEHGGTPSNDSPHSSARSRAIYSIQP